MKTLSRLLFLGVVTSLCVSCDQVTKGIASARLAERPPIALLGDTVRLSYAENRGGFLSLGEGLPEPLRWVLFVGLTTALVAVLAAFAIRSRAIGRWRLLALALVIAGGAGNLLDRIALGVVRDFLNVGIGPIRTGVFNVADVAILLGAALLVLSAGGSRAAPDAGPR